MKPWVIWTCIAIVMAVAAIGTIPLSMTFGENIALARHAAKTMAPESERPLRFDTARVEEIPRCGTCRPEFIVTFPNGRSFRGYEIIEGYGYYWWSYPDGHALDYGEDWKGELTAAMTRRTWEMTR
jgi:hypothetical protein